MASACSGSEVSSRITVRSQFDMCDLVLSLLGKVFFPLLLKPTPQMSSTKLGVCFRFQSEKETGDRNYAIGYYLKEKKVTGKGW